MINTKSNKTLKFFSIALICLMLSALTVQSPSGQTFGLWAVLNNDPYWGGYSGGCHDLMYMMRTELAKIGIDVDVYIQGDMWANWELIWKAPIGGAKPGKAPYGWDLHIMDWWLHNLGFLWMDSIILAKCITPYGYNMNPYISKENDELFWGMQTSLDPQTRQNFAFAWQAELMHNPPVAAMWYPYTYNIRSKYIKNYDSDSWWYDMGGLHIDYQEIKDDLSPTVKSRLDAGKLIFGGSEPWLYYLTTFIDSYTDEMIANLISGTLYKKGLDWETHVDGQPGEGYFYKPWLATDLPHPKDGEGVEWLDTDGEWVYRVIIPLRNGTVWSDGDPFDAKDVWFSTDIICNPSTMSSGWGDFAPIIKRAEYVDNAGGLHKATGRHNTPTNWNSSAIAMICHDPHADLPLILANVWGAGIIPEHVVGPLFDSYGYSGLKSNSFAAGSPATDYDGAVTYLPSIGPCKYQGGAQGASWGYDWISMPRNTRFFGYNASLLTDDEKINGDVWGPDVQEMTIRYIPSSPVRLTAIQTHEIDWAEYPVTSCSTFEHLKATDDTLLIYEAPDTTGNYLWFNFNNPYLSNRYVRLAIAHAIPYGSIMDKMPGWGITETVPGISFVLPWHIYSYKGTETPLFNTKLMPYEYDLTKAKQYLDMWYYTQTGLTGSANIGKGAAGDANFDGVVNLDDLWLYVETYGDDPLTREIDWWDTAWSDGEYCWPVTEGASLAPGNDVDADFDNGGDVGGEDYLIWLAHWHDEYPFEGAR